MRADPVDVHRTHLPRMYWPILMLTLLGYVSLTQAIKVWLLRKQWI